VKRGARRGPSARALDVPAQKRCFDCRLELPSASFYTNRASRDGLQSRCRACDSEHRRARSEIVVVSSRLDAARERARRRALFVAPPARVRSLDDAPVGGLLLAGYRAPRVGEKEIEE
jgi:hypothetical protein